MSKIVITLSAYNMGPNATEKDFNKWATFVVENIDDALGFEVHEVNQHPFVGGPELDTIEGATDEQEAAIREYLEHYGWDDWCGSSAA